MRSIHNHKIEWFQLIIRVIGLIIGAVYFGYN